MTFDPAVSVAGLNRGEDNYLGMRKFPADVHRYESVIGRTKPDVIVECGSYRGMSAVWFAQFADVVSVDINPVALNTHGGVDGITWLIGSSVDPTVIDRVTTIVAGRRVLVSLDSDHSAEHVYAEMCAYAGLVHPGDYMVVEDGIVRQWWGITGPLDAIERFTAERPEWTVDRDVEDMFETSGFPSGWLRLGDTHGTDTRS